MNFEEIEKIMADAGVSVCPICGTPYSKYHKRQRTCGNDECRREWKNKYLKEWRRKRIEANADEFRAYRADAMRKYREKMRALEERDEQLEEIEEKWEKVDDFDKYVSEHGMEYGDRQAQKVLAGVSRIDVNIERREK